MQREKFSLIYDILLIAMLAVAAFLRLSGADWGELQHQHPDEGFLVSVIGNLRAHECIDPNIPVDECPPEQQRWISIGDYFNSAESTLNPYNRGFSFFVYGNLPLTIVRIAAEATGQTDFGMLKLLARQFSALADLGTIFLLYLIVAKLYNRRTALLAAAFSSFAVLQIQQSHFFTTDLFVNLFALLAIYFAVGIVLYERGKRKEEVKRDGLDTLEPESPVSLLQPPVTITLRSLLLDKLFWLSIAFGFAFGLSMASKVNIFPLALLLPGAFTIRLIRDKEERERFLATDYPGPNGGAGAGWKLVTIYLIVGGAAAFLAFRIFQPYAFNGIMPSEQWLSNIAEQRVQARGDADLPWNLQWARRSHLYSFENLTIWGLGLPLGILSWIGFLYMGWRILKGDWQHALLWGWTAFYFLWQSTEFNPTMRYQLPIYPLLVMMAAWVVFEVAHPFQSPVSGLALKNVFSVIRKLAIPIGLIVLAATAVWAFAFHTIYVRDETRIAASRWIYRNVPGPINLRYGIDAEAQQPLSVPQDTSFRDSLPYISAFSVSADVADGDVGAFGPLKEVYLPHIAAQAGTGPQTLTLTIATAPDALPDQVVATSSVIQDFSPVGDRRGPSATFTFKSPVPLSFGQTYFLKLETNGSPLTLNGAAVANETDYDYGLPFRVDGYDGFGGIYRGDLNLQVYWDDNADKLARFEETLNLADYIFIPTNHQYAQITRLPERYPLTTEYYRQLIGCPPERNIIECYRVAEPGTFKGNLGFDLVAVFESYPTLGSITINDQSAEEAFTFYDHPKVFIFKKSGDYEAQKVAEILGNVDLTNVVHLVPREAATYKSMMLPEDRLAQQQGSGTWSKLFDYDWLQNKYPVIGLVIWYLFVFLLGVLTYPITRLVMPGLGDKGYALSRTLGLVILAYIPWLLSSLGVPHTRLLIGLVFLSIAVAGLVLGWMRRDDLLEEWRSNRRQFLMIEGVFLSFFLFDLFIRIGNPDLWHPAKGGERPMDFSYFNAVIKSTTFPPYDPWFAGGYINYYYYGFVLVSTPVKLLGVVPSIAYNFILPTLFAIVGTSAFSIGWNLMERGKMKEENGPLSIFLFHPPFIAGLAAALLMVVLGNLGIIQMVFQALARLAAPGGTITDVDFIQRLSYAAQGLYKTIAQGVALPIGRGEWYWNPSRVIPPGPGNEITEFPFFTFLYSDLHAHMIVLILTTFVIAWALATVRARRTSFLSIIAGALVIGALYPTNLSDIYTYLPVGFAALIYAIWRASDAPKMKWLPSLSSLLKRTILTVLAVALLTLLSFWLYEPYRATYSQAYRALDPWTASKTPISSYLTHWGLFLFLIFTWLVWETRQWMAATPVSSLGKLKPFQILIELALAVFIVALLYLAYRKAWVGWIALPLAAWAGVLLLRPDQPDRKRLALFWIGTAMLITIVVELFTVRGDIGRMNTIFKFYLQAWTLLAVSSGAALTWILADLHTWRPRWRTIWQTGLTILFTGAALYTVAATTDKVSDRISPTAPHTLDSMTYMAYSEYWETNTMDLSQDYRAIRWMQDNVQDSPVIVEANCPEYRWCTRFTIYTGLPGVVGWNWHQRQQRALGPPNQVFERVDAVGQFYNTTDIDSAVDFINRYDVRYIIVGQLERNLYDAAGLQKFEQYEGGLWKSVYQDAQTTIYQVAP